MNKVDQTPGRKEESDIRKKERGARPHQMTRGRIRLGFKRGKKVGSEGSAYDPNILFGGDAPRPTASGRRPLRGVWDCREREKNAHSGEGLSNWSRRRVNSKKHQSPSRKKNAGGWGSN